MASVEDEYANIPDFDSLPPVKDMPQGCAWGIFDRKDQKKDHLGCLNLLTQPVVQRALREEARDGISISLNWPIGAIRTPGFARKGLKHTVYSFQDNPNPDYQLCGNDDEIDFNTQCSSQWDSLVHYAHQPSKTNYNNTQGNKDNLTQDFGAWDIGRDLPTLNHWHSRGGLVGRGVLIDYRAYLDSLPTTNPLRSEYDCFNGSKIYVSDLEKALEWQDNTQLRQGDIIIIRTGFTEELAKLDGEGQESKLAAHQYCGVYGSTETARWFWNKHPSAVASDSIAFEQIPPVKESDGQEGGIADLVLHPYFLSLFGLNIGELWDLKALSDTCREKKRYSFLLTSVPLNVPGAVGSPPNALAIF